MRQLDELLFELLHSQTEIIESYKELIQQVEAADLRAAFRDNFKHLAILHKEIIFHLKERIEGFEPDSESDDDEEDDED